MNRQTTKFAPRAPVLISVMPRARILLSLFLALLLPCAALAEERRIDGPQRLAQAIDEAAPGDILRLEPGAYGDLRISRRFEGKPLTITAADPDNRPEFSRLVVHGAQGLVLEDLAVLWRITDQVVDPADMERYRAASVEKSQNIILRRILFEGDVLRTGRPEVHGYGTGYGLWVRGVQDITIEGCEFRIWNRALIVSDSQDITLRGSEFHSLRSDGVNFVAVNRLMVENNWFHDFDRAPDSGDHADMIQFWTNRSKTPSTDITIRNNLLNSGHGLYTQSIFMRNEEVDTGRAGPEMYYRNIQITGNIIINAHLHGITLGAADGVLIASNTLVRNRLSAGPGGSPGLWTPSVRLAETSENVVIQRNIVPKITGPEKRPDWKVEDNLIIQDTRPSRPDHYDKVFAAAVLGDPSSLASFAYAPGGPADGRSLGAPGLRPEQIAARGDGADLAVLQVSQDPSFINRFHFDAAQTLKTAQTVPVWDFGDGQGAKGEKVSHDFAAPGQYQVVLQTGSTKNDRTVAWVSIPEPQLLRFDPKLGLISAGKPIEGITPKGGVLAFGGHAGSIEVPASAISGIFTRQDFELILELTSTGGANASGEILRIHEAFILNITPTGSLMLTLFEKGQKKPRQLRSPPARLNDGHPHRISMAATAKAIDIHIDGSLALRVKLNGPIQQAVNRPLVLGGAFGKLGIPIEIRDLRLTAGAHSFAPR